MNEASISNPHVDELELLPVDDEAAKSYANKRFSTDDERRLAISVWKFLRSRYEENQQREDRYYRSSPNGVSDPRYFGMS